MELSVTKVSVTESQPKLWNITLNLKITENSVVVHDEDFSIKYREGEDIAVKQQKILGQMQAVIDSYKGSQTIFDHTKMDSLVTFLNVSLET